MTTILGQTATVSWAPDGSGTATLAVMLPDGTAMVPAPTVAAASSPYSADIDTTQPGRHLLTWTRAGDVFVDVLDVWPTDPRYVVSLTEAARFVSPTAGLPKSTTLADLPIFVATATDVLEQLVGDVLPISRTKRVWSRDGMLVLPSVGVSNVSVTVGGNALTTVTVNEDAGIVYGLPPTSTYPTAPVVEVTYTAGGPLPPALRLAALLLIRHLWNGSRLGGTADNRQPAPSDVATPYGFAIPKRVIELCETVQSTPGFA